MRLTLNSTIVAIGNPLELDLLEAYLKDADPPVVVAKAASVVQGLVVLKSPRFAHVKLALLYPPVTGMDVIESIRQLRRLRADVPVAVLSSDASAQTVQRAIGAGACGFIPERQPASAFVATLHLLMTGGKYCPEPGSEDRASAPRSTADHIVDALTPRELEALLHLSECRSNKEIARAMGIEIVTVTLHLTNLYRKLGVSGRAHAIRLALAARLQADDRWTGAKIQPAY